MSEEIRSIEVAEMHTPAIQEETQAYTSSPLFHRLSEEIRGAIWHELWKDTSCIDLYKNTPVQVFLQYGPKADRSKADDGLPQWLLTNKATLEEGLNQLRRHATWSVSRRWNRYTVKSGSNNLSQFPRRNPLAGLPAAKKISIQQKDSQVCLQDALFGPIHRPLESITPLLSPDLKELNLQMKVTYHPQGRWAIQPLRAERMELNLEKITVGVQMHVESYSRNASSTRPIDYATERDICQNEVVPLLRAGIARLAGIWMDQNFLVHVENMDKKAAWQEDGGIKVTAAKVGVH